MLTLQMLKDMKPQTIFARGTFMDSPLFFNVTGSGKMLEWIAIRGDIHDRTIYMSREGTPDEEIARHGDKIHYKDIVERLINADDEASQMFRK